MDENSRPSDESLVQPIALAMQGMAFWYLVAGIAGLVFVALVLVSSPGSEQTELYGVSAIFGAEVAGAGLAGALLLGGFSWALQRGVVWRPRWSLILLPGLIGAATSQAFDLMDWPVSVLAGGFVAFWLMRARLESMQTAGSSE